VGDTMHVKIPNKMQTVDADAIVRSITPDGIGIEFVHMRPEDTKLLRHLITELLE